MRASSHIFQLHGNMFYDVFMFWNMAVGALRQLQHMQGVPLIGAAAANAAALSALMVVFYVLKTWCAE
jgi:hypothetical protein